MSATARKLQNALNQFQAGNLSGANAATEEILKAAPNNAEAWHLSGMVKFSSGHPQESESALRKAVELAPNAAWFKTNLALVLIHQRAFSEAEQLCTEVLKVEPRNTIALANRGTALRNLNRRREALLVFEKATSIERSAQSLCNQATVLVDLGRFEEAHRLLTEAQRLDPNLWEVQKNLAVVLKEVGQQKDVQRQLQTMELLQPDSVDLHETRAATLLENEQPIEAIECYQAALAKNPESAPAVFGLGCALLKIGAWPESLEAFRLAAMLEPDNPARASAMLYTSSLCGHLPFDEIVRLHHDWGRELEANTPVITFQPDVSTERPLRVGYVSPDFRGHATMSFLYPMLRAHDRSAFEFVLYSETSHEDQATDVVRLLGDEWRNTKAMSDDEMAAQIREDQIDILVDLAGHSADNRLPVFARKPAPVQVSFLGYPTTTGLSRIDYFLTDVVREPSDPEVFYAEKPVMLPNGACCFEPRESIVVAPPPCVNNGFVTFGSTHRMEKMSDDALRLWVEVLCRNPSAKLMVFRDSFRTESNRLRLAQRLKEIGADLQRVSFAWDLPDSHLKVYERFDIMLDVFPWGSGTIAYDAMWMGVPIPTISGDRAGCRATASLLHHCGLPELIANSAAEYVEVVSQLAVDPERLAELRTLTRTMMLETVCSGDRFARDIETTYRNLWTEFCTSERSKSATA